MQYGEAMRKAVKQTSQADENLRPLLRNPRGLIQQARQQVLRAVDVVQVQTGWEIGRHIVEFEQKGFPRAEYGNPGDLGGMSALVRHIAAERLGKLLPVAGEDLRILRPARDSDISHAVVDEVPGSLLCVDVDEHAISGLALAGMTGDGIAMVQVRMLSGVDAHAPAAVQLQAHSAIVGDALDSPELAVGDLQVIRRRSELDTISDRKHLLLLSID
jgi:hypothetical protein